MIQLIILTMCLLFTNSLSAEFREIHQVSEVLEVVRPVKNSDWVLFDIDYTLTAPDHPMLQMAVIKQNKKLFREELENIASKPARVILIDDALENLQTVQQELSQLNIPFVGLHYVPKEDSETEFSEKQWRAVWDSIKKRAEKALFVESFDEKARLQISFKANKGA